MVDDRRRLTPRADVRGVLTLVAMGLVVVACASKRQNEFGRMAWSSTPYPPNPVGPRLGP